MTNHRRRRTASILLTALLASALVAGCTADGGEPDETDDTPTAAAGADGTGGATPSASSPAGASPTAGEPGDGAAPTSPATGGGQDHAAGTPVVTSAVVVGTSVEVSGYVDGVVVDDGECRFELLGGGSVVSASSRSLADAASTACPSVTVDAPSGSPSQWRARLVWVPTGAVSEELPVG
ncbi:hypothetical protein OMK64_15635 [Cellulomonas fimi]|uniref:hypothetical protein n=1 Tax=Cellulomonas fimi TaxID=1708 RepID=UPI00234D6481|nr:hypothetical protein [Cellulomonas fimi]MDC7122965.1 hypothetical protein [Cellulomonas fimi]